MKIPIQSQPIIRDLSTAQMSVNDGVNPSFNWKCAIKCAGKLATCATSDNVTQCLISAGASDCLSCL